MSKETNKRQVEKAREMRENMKTKEKSQIRWSPWQILRASGTAAASQGRLRCLGQKKKKKD